MFKYLKSSNVSTIYKVVEEWELHVDDQKLGVKILLDGEGYFYYRTSHYYVRTGQATTNISSINRCSTKEEALMLAEKQLLNFYDISDDGAMWYQNKNY